MNRFVIAFLIILITTATAFAQRHRPVERIHAAKMAYITERLHLSRRQAADFLPVYNEYEKEKRDVRTYFFKKYKGSDRNKINDSTSLQYIDDNLDYQQEVIRIKRKYNELFLRYISPQQLRDLNTAEREFKEILINRLERQRGRGRNYNRRSNY